jgi:hypothetical protein
VTARLTAAAPQTTPRSAVAGPAAAAPISRAAPLGRIAARYGYLGWLALPMLLYLIPLFEGYAWNNVTPSYLPHNVLNPPEEYRGRLPITRTTAEVWGASVSIVPFQARTRE